LLLKSGVTKRLDYAGFSWVDYCYYDYYPNNEFVFVIGSVVYNFDPNIEVDFVEFSWFGYCYYYELKILFADCDVIEANPYYYYCGCCGCCCCPNNVLDYYPNIELDFDTG
jgi:hypothetical protein